MATPRRPKVARSVKPMRREDLQPGTVGAVLSRESAGGVTTLETDQAASASAEDAQVVKRRAFLELARRRWQRSGDAESELRTNMLEDLEFYNSDQWPDNIKAQRQLDKRPMLTINRLPQFVRQVVNQARESRPAIQVNPVDNGSDPDTAEVFQGLIRNIERQSKAHIAYSTANEHQAIFGRGWWRIIAEYARSDSFEQEIRIRRIQDAFTVYPDPSCCEPDYSDAIYCFIIERVSRDEFRVRYGEEQFAATTSSFTSIGDDQAQWAGADGLQVAEYFYIENIPDRIADYMVTSIDPQSRQLIETRVISRRDSIKPEDLVVNPMTGAPRIKILKERDTIRRQVKWALISGSHILEGNKDLTAGKDIPGSYIPVVPVLGEELVVNGKKNLRGMIRDAKDPQRAYNFWVSAETEMIALAPRAPVVGAAGMFEGHEEKWNDANQRNFAYLEYNPIELNGVFVPRPERSAFDPNIGPIINATMQADRDLKSVIGMFDASQEQSREQSGKAILARQQQGEQGTSHFLDNLARSIEHTGRILLEWIPVYYDTPRMLRIFGLDEQPTDVLVHKGHEDAAAKMAADPALRSIKSGKPFDLGVGRYDVTITIGPSYASRRQEAVESIVQLISANPNLAPYVADILVRNMDWPGAQQLAKRLEKIVPPEARDDEEGKPTVPPEIQQQLMQMEQQIQMLTEALGEKDEIIRSKAQELASKGQIEQMKLQSQERVEMIRAQAAIAQIAADTKGEAAIVVLKAELERIAQKLEHEHQKETQITEHALMPPPTRDGGGGSRADARA